MSVKSLSNASPASTIILVSLPTYYICMYIHSYKHTYRHTHPHTYLPTHLPTHVPTYPPTYLLTYVPTHQHTHLPTYVHQRLQLQCALIHCVKLTARDEKVSMTSQDCCVGLPVPLTSVHLKHEEDTARAGVQEWKTHR